MRLMRLNGTLALSLKTLFTASNDQNKVCLYIENNREKEENVGANTVEHSTALVYTVILILAYKLTYKRFSA